MSFPGITVHTGFLVALERSRQRAVDAVAQATARRARLTLPVAVLAEWWRGGSRQARYLLAFKIEPMSERVAKSAGEAIAVVPGATVVDSIVMASAAQRDDVVYTSDFDDLSRLRERHFRGVRVLGVGAWRRLPSLGSPPSQRGSAARRPRA